MLEESASPGLTMPGGLLLLSLENWVSVVYLCVYNYIHSLCGCVCRQMHKCHVELCKLVSMKSWWQGRESSLLLACVQIAPVANKAVHAIFTLQCENAVVTDLLNWLNTVRGILSYRSFPHAWGYPWLLHLVQVLRICLSIFVCLFVCFQAIKSPLQPKSKLQSLIKWKIHPCS